MKKYGNAEGNAMNYNNFKDFMVDLLGVSDTKDDILQSFKLLNKGEESTKPERMELLMEDPDIKYYTTTAKKNADGTYEYANWTDDVFSR